MTLWISYLVTRMGMRRMAVHDWVWGGRGRGEDDDFDRLPGYSDGDEVDEVCMIGSGAERGCGG